MQPEAREVAVDQIDQAIAAAEAPAPEPLQQVTVTIASTGRHVVIAFPPDMTDAEALEFVGWVGTQLRIALAQQRASAAGPQLWTPPAVRAQ